MKENKPFLASGRILQLLENLIRIWGYFEVHRNYYLHELLPQLKVKSVDNPTPEEVNLIKQISQEASPIEWEELEWIAENLEAQKQEKYIFSRKMTGLLQAEAFEEAERYVMQFGNPNLMTEYQRLAADRVISLIQTLLSQGNTSLAREKLNLHNKTLGDVEYTLWDQKIRLQEEAEWLAQARKKECSLLTDVLSCFHFAQADVLFEQAEHITLPEYEQIKAHYIQRYVSTHLSKFPINDEQAKVLAHTSCNLLVKARAGSGKTRILAYKTALLLQDNVRNPDEILILAFNKNAAQEIRYRIRQKFNFDQFDNVHTFHGLAHQLVRPTGFLLFDERDNGISAKKFSLFIQDLLPGVIDATFRGQLYALFRREMKEIENAGLTLHKAEYYTYRRSVRQITLGGEIVKSKGEKWIADFLFEHDIKYKYEEVWFWGEEHYHPDFTIRYPQQSYIIEHWMIDEHHEEELPEWWGKTWNEYNQEMQHKRLYWQNKKIALIETSVRDVHEGREYFEAILKQKLECLGIVCNKLPQEELYRRLEITHLSRFARLTTQFIQKAKKQSLSPTVIRQKLPTGRAYDERTNIFVELATRVYEVYENKKREQGYIDFDDLLLQAIQLVHQSKGECDLIIRHTRSIRINELRWILIDEYQDFSPLFNRLIQVIRENNPNVRLFCVGDDWQAINGFAGSELEFFEKFEDYVGQARIAQLVTNHRSQKMIIQNSNALMAELGAPALPLPDQQAGDAQIKYIDDIRLKFRSSGNEQVRQMDIRFQFHRNDILAAKYAKQCYEIITMPENIGKTIAILNRMNKLYSVDLAAFQRKLIACLSDEERRNIGNPANKIRVETVHRFKGLEADIAILIQVTEDTYPLIHPDNALFTIFGHDEFDILAEERRLFYVALTRAKEKVYILTERGRESPFLRELPAYLEAPKYDDTLRNLMGNRTSYIC